MLQIRLLLLLCSLHLKLHCALDVSIDRNCLKKSGNIRLHLPTSTRCCIDTSLQGSNWPCKLRNSADVWNNKLFDAPKKTILRLRGGLVVSRHQLELERIRQQEAARLCADKEENETRADDASENWKPMCRICYDDEPHGLFAPCHCSGSMRFVHRYVLSFTPTSMHTRKHDIRRRAIDLQCPPFPHVFVWMHFLLGKNSVPSFQQQVSEVLKEGYTGNV
jgi:hypothetical protein